MNTAIKYPELYQKLQDQVGPNTQQILQSFTLNNNQDIIKAIDFCKAERASAGTLERAELEEDIIRYKNIMKQRLLITEDMFAVTMPLREQGPAKFTENPDFSKSEKEDDNDRKIIEHPAVPKNKKESKPEKKVEKTINDKLGEKNDEKKEIKKEKQALKTTYDKCHPTMEAKLASINALLPTIEADIKSGNEDAALRRLKYHLKCYGENVPFCTIDQIQSLIHWIKEDKFQHLSPFSILHDEPLSIADIVKEATKLVKEDGYTKDKLKEYMEYYVLDNQLKDQTEDKIIRSKEAYEKFFLQSMGFLFDPTDERNKSVDIKPKSEEKTTEKDIKKNLYEIHKGDGWKAIRNIAKDFHDYFLAKKEKSNLKDRLSEVVGFIKTIDPPLYKEYKEHKSTTEPAPDTTNKVEKSTKEPTSKPVEPKVETSTTNVSPSKVEFPRLEDFCQKRHTKEAIAEFLISIVNKPIGPIGEMKNGKDAQIENLTKLAKKRFLEDNPVNDCQDWKESDVAEFMAQLVIPFITDDYAILSSLTTEDLNENLKYFIKKFPAGKEKERNEALKHVLIGKPEVARSKFMKSIARPVRKDHWDEINTAIKTITDTNKDQQKKEKTK